MFNTLIVLGFAGLISPLLLQKDTVTKEIPFVFFGTILVALLSNNFFTGSTGLSFWDGIILVACLVIFIFYVTGIPRTAPQEGYKNLSFIKTILLIFAGVAGLFLGGEFVVRNSVIIAEQLGMSKKFISLTIVALGTSLPELVTSLIAIKKQSSDIAVGNVIGSNLFNIFMVLGVTSIIKPIAFDTALNFDLLILTAITFVLFLLVCIGKIKKLNRFEAALLLVLYGVYIYYLFQRG